MPNVWQDLTEFARGQLWGRNDANKFKGNIEFLRTPANYFYQRDFGDANYTTTNTSFEDIDSVNMNIQLETFGNPVRIELHGRITHSTTGFVYFALAVDGVSVSNAAANGVWEGRADLVRGVDLSRLVFPDAGLHTFTARWRTSTGTATFLTESAIQFEVHEEY